MSYLLNTLIHIIFTRVWLNSSNITLHSYSVVNFAWNGSGSKVKYREGDKEKKKTQLQES